MANLFIELDPGGVPSDVSEMGQTKTITVDSTFTGKVIIEGNCGGGWVQIATFQSPSTQTIEAMFSEVRVQGQASPPPDISISGDNSGGKFLDLPLNTAVDVSAFGTFNTVLVSGVVTGGQVDVEISEDGTHWVELLKFSSSGFKSKDFIARWMRAQYSGTGTPLVCVGAANDPISALALGPPTKFVYQQGGEASGNVYTDWATMFAAIAATSGPKVLLLDPTFEDPVTPAGTWDCTDLYVSSTYFSQVNIATWTWEDGAFLPELNTINMEHGAWFIDNLSVSGPVISYAGDGSLELNYNTDSLIAIRPQAGEATSPAVRFAGFGILLTGRNAAVGFNSTNSPNSAAVDAPVVEHAFGFFLYFSQGGGANKNALTGTAFVSFRILGTPQEGPTGIEDQPLYTGTIDKPRVMIAPPINIYDKSDTVDLRWGGHAPVDTSGGVGTVNLRSCRNRNGYVAEVKDDAPGNASLNNITVNAFKAEGALTSFTATEIIGFDPLAVGSAFNPGDEVVVSGGTAEDGTYVVESLVITGVPATSGLTIQGAAFTPAVVAGTVTYQETIDGSPTAVISADLGSLRLRVGDGSGKISVM